jgi:ATP-binding cassette subfamily F protein 3
VLSHNISLNVYRGERIALIGSNGIGKTTLLKVINQKLDPLAGRLKLGTNVSVGYFTQYQVEELASDDTPLEHMTRAMNGATPGAVRAQLGRFGFSGNRATTRVGQLSGGERARLALALITRDAPHLLILDEPTNHLDVDAREALVQALNAFDGAVILISHDRHMVELTADRLVLVDDGTATDYPGSIEDYIDFVLGRNQPKADARPKGDKKDRKAAARSREEARQIRNEVADAEAEMARLQEQVSSLDRAMFDPASAEPALRELTMGELARRRAEVAKELERAEARWLSASERLERQAA